SRRRHTRFSRDWSSDVCSSDLGEDAAPGTGGVQHAIMDQGRGLQAAEGVGVEGPGQAQFADAFLVDLIERAVAALIVVAAIGHRSEERRVGKEGRCRGGPY